MPVVVTIIIFMTTIIFTIVTPTFAFALPDCFFPSTLSTQTSGRELKGRLP